jgi:YVTN family beta-propeller protein
MLNQDRFFEMLRVRFFLIYLLFFFMNGCLPQEPVYKVPSNEEGRVIIYLQPVPQEANRLRFIIDSISAVRDDGSEIPLSLSFDELKGADLTGLQKLLASGVLPPGSYTGLAIRVEKALVQTEEGELALFIPEEPVTAVRPFKVKRREALLLFLSLDPSGAITNGIRFTPGFSLATPGRGLINLTGYVSNSESNLISVFNKKTMQVVDAISTGREPKGLALDQKRARGYVATSRDDAVEVYDVFRGSIIGTIKLNFGDRPHPGWEDSSIRQPTVEYCEHH